MTSDRAEAILAEAFANRYRYPANFGGFTARASYGPEGGGAVATVAMCGPGDVEAVPDASDEFEGWEHPIDESLLQELRSLSRLLWSHDYALGEGRPGKSLVDDPHPLGALVVLHDDPHRATFRVRDGRLTQITRRHGTLLEVARVERWHVRHDGSVLPARFVVEFWDDACAEPLRVDRYWDLFRPIEGELVPLVRRGEHCTEAGTITRVLTLRSWHLASTPA